MDIVVISKFTKSVSNLLPEWFVKDILLGKLGMREIYVSENFYFGKDAKGDEDTLMELAHKLAFKAHIVKLVKAQGTAISSSLIRRLIVKGDLAKAALLLGRPVSVLGTVVRGRRRGRTSGSNGVGIPTGGISGCAHGGLTSAAHICYHGGGGWRGHRRLQRREQRSERKAMEPELGSERVAQYGDCGCAICAIICKDSGCATNPCLRTPGHRRSADQGGNRLCGRDGAGRRWAGGV